MSDGRRGIGSRLMTGIVVSGITLLVWLAADQHVTESEEFPVQVRLASAAPDRYVGFAEPPHQRSFKVVLRGRRSRLRDFVRMMDSNVVLTAMIDTTATAGAMPRTLSVEEEIFRHINEIRDTRLTVVSAEPRTVSVIIDTYTTVPDVRVKPVYGDLKVSPEYLRGTVSARVPKFVEKLLGNAPIASAIPKQSVRSVARPDGSFEVAGVLTFDVLERLDPSLRVEFEPSNEVVISGRIDAMTATESKGPIQINWSVPDEVQRDFAVVCDQASFRVHIDVTGPKERLAQLDPRRIRAFVDVLAGDVDNPGPNKEITRDVRFILPSEFSDCSIAPDAPSHQVRFRLEPRAAGVTPVSAVGSP